MAVFFQSSCQNYLIIGAYGVVVISKHGVNSSHKTSKSCRLLCVEQIMKMTDETCPITAGEIVALLKEHGIKAERRSIYRDISTLCEHGIDIIYSAAGKRGYYLAANEFEAAEVQLIISSLYACNFITDRQAQKITDKLLKMLSPNSGAKIVIPRHTKNAANEKLLYILDAAITAINDKRCARICTQISTISSGIDSLKVSDGRLYLVLSSGLHINTEKVCRIDVI